jgi:hypothetical protein
VRLDETRRYSTIQTLENSSMSMSKADNQKGRRVIFRFGSPQDPGVLRMFNNTSSTCTPWLRIQDGGQHGSGMSCN